MAGYIHSITDRIAAMQFDLSTQSEKLSQFYRDYFKAAQTVKDGERFHVYFQWLPVAGLYANLNTWMMKKNLNPDDAMRVEFELLNQFLERALPQAYPFNYSSVDYYNDAALAQAHTNPARMLWVQKHLVYSAEQAAQYMKENV
jgi:hypothetical protein